MEIVKTAGVQKIFVNGENTVHALRGVTLSIEEGEFVAIIGSSGSGKTTLMNLLGGLMEPSEGGVWIRENSLRDMNDEELTIFRRRNIGFVFQQYNLVPVLDVYENIVLPVRLDEACVDEAYLSEIVELLGIKEKLDQMPGMLSGGQQQRVAIARAMLTKPALLLCDEPTGNLDSENTREVIQLLKKSAAKFHQTVVVVTHEEEVASQADRIIRLEDGKISENAQIC